MRKTTKIMAFLGCLFCAVISQASLNDDIKSKTYTLDPREKIVGIFNLSSLEDHPEWRYMSPGAGIFQNGWGYFKNKFIEPMLAAGAKRIMLWGPFGRTDKPGLYEFCGYKQALKHQPPEMARHFTDEFAQVWKDIDSRPGVEVMMYVGGPHIYPEQMPPETDETAYWQEMMECLQPFFDADSEILGLDNSSGSTPDTWTGKIARWWHDNRGPVIIESRPTLGAPQFLDGYKILSNNLHWDMQSPELDKNREQFNSYEWEFTGEVIEQIWWFTENNFDKSKDALRDGHTIGSENDYVIQKQIGNFPSYEAFLRHLDTDAAQRVDLSPHNPIKNSGLKFTILDGPNFGVLKPMWFDPTGSVFLYTPSLYSSGTDEILFKVTQGNQETGVKKITINFNGLKGSRSSNRAPVVDIGADVSSELQASVLLNPNVSDDRLSPTQLKGLWTKVSGPGEVVFGDRKKIQTTAVFSAVGDYVLRLTVYDGDMAEKDDITVSIEPANASESGSAEMKVLNNPINPDKGETAQLFVALKNNSLVQADVLDRHGALIRRISDQEYIKGEHVIYWDGRNEANAIVASGIYMVRVKTGGKTTVQKIAVIR
jgi:hypothetical protein